MAHVVVVTYPAQGHINPLLQFAKRLASKGLKATLATTPYTINSIHSSTVGVEPISDGFDEGGFNQSPGLKSYLESFRTVGSATLTQLITKFMNSGTPVSCIVYDSLLTWAADVAKQQGIFSAIFLTNSASVCSFYWQVQMGLLTLPLKKHQTFPVSLPGIPPLNFSDFPSFLASSDLQSHSAYLSLILEMFQFLDENDWVFCNSFEGLEIELVEAMRGVWPVEMVGPMVPSAYLDRQIDGDTSYGSNQWKPMTSDHCLEWLNTKAAKSVIYVSFGSMADVSAKQVEELAMGLKASNLPFLWVLKKDSEKNMLPVEFLSSNDQTGLVVAWCCQVEVLAHEAIGCFVTHCGWNSTLEGLSLGVPMVGVAQWSDQPTNAKFMEEVWKVGVRAKKDDENGIVTRDEFGRCLMEVMVGERSDEIRRNACKWRDSAMKAVSAGGSSDMKINEFVVKLMEERKNV